ncbi:hypothetical protein LX32DRAFT_452471 [Colletotrichum zoysiae]|uniref:Uncharacterized protein n=1 Tax=Colletotrichum zoysiae TaxID=1216348 RepID=A0AAD9M3A5_9PEZI|nr:hypothetical protein LX32DRAFT_452471 [Colletotrichum zoysiae]
MVFPLTCFLWGSSFFPKVCIVTQSVFFCFYVGSSRYLLQFYFVLAAFVSLSHDEVSMIHTMYM